MFHRALAAAAGGCCEFKHFFTPMISELATAIAIDWFVPKHKLVCLRLGKDLAPDRFSNLAASEATHSC